MKNPIKTSVLAAVLCGTVVLTGCSPQWLSTALADLPVLTQMALNIAALVSTLQAGERMNPAEAAAIQNISAEANRDLNLLQTLYSDYKASPDQSKLQGIQNAIRDMNQNLAALLQSAHISDAAVAERIGAAVNLILTTVNSFAALIPQGARQAAVPQARELKAQWNQRVCATADCKVQ